MKLFNTVLLTSAFVLPSFAFAGTAGQTLQVHVPFSFKVGAQQFGAGDYRIQQNESGVIFVQGEGKAAAAISTPADLKAGNVSSLSFTSADQHYLTGVQVQGESSRSIAVSNHDQRKVTFTSSR